MSNFDTILFDLDGTLTDPAIGITNSVIYSLKKFGITVTDRKELYSFIGPPLIDSFMSFYGFSKEKAQLAIEYYREYFKEKGIFENTPYNGVASLLYDLKANNKKLILATSKPLIFAKRILKHFDLYKYFDLVVGATLDGSLGEKSEIIAEALRQLKKVNLTHCAMIGDRKFDIEGAINNGITPIGVLYGYGSKEELNNAGAQFLAENIEQLRKILIN